MATIFEHVPSGTTITLDRNPDLGETLASSKDEDVLVTDAGVRRVFNRRVDFKRLVLPFNLLNPVERADLERFFYDVVGQGELFNLTMEIPHFAPLQVASTLDGVPIAVGSILPAFCGLPARPILVGDWVPQDSYIYANMRFNQSEIQFEIALPDSFNTSLNMIQEIN